MQEIGFQNQGIQISQVGAKQEKYRIKKKKFLHGLDKGENPKIQKWKDPKFCLSFLWAEVNN